MLCQFLERLLANFDLFSSIIFFLVCNDLQSINLVATFYQNEFDSTASAYLKEEFRRIYTNEKTWRERLWRNGIIRSSPMTPRVKPDYVGTEEVFYDFWLMCA